MVSSRALGTLMDSFRYLLAAWSALQQHCNAGQYNNKQQQHKQRTCQAGHLQGFLAAWLAMQQQQQQLTTAAAYDVKQQYESTQQYKQHTL
jgi:hypothetical protein